MAILRLLFGEHARILRDQDYQLLLYASVVSAMGLVLLSPLLEQLTGAFHISEVQAGLLMTAFVAPAAVVVPFVGSLADRHGRRPVLAASLLLFGSAGTAIVLTTNFELILVLRALQGVGSAGIIPVIITSLGDLYTDAEPTAQGLRITAVGTSQTVIPLLGGVLVGIAWQLPFLLYSLALPAAVLVYLRFEESLDTRASNTGRYIQDLLGLLRQPRVLGTLIALPMPVFIYISYLTYSSFLIVRTLDGSPAQAGILLGLANGAYGTAASQAGRAVDLFENGATPITMAFGAMAGGIIGFSQANGLVVAGLGSVMMALGGGLSSSILLSTLTDLAPERLRAGLVSLSQSALRGGMAVAPLAVGGLITLLEVGMGGDEAIRWAFLVVGVSGAVIGSIAILLPQLLAPRPLSH